MDRVSLLRGLHAIGAVLLLGNVVVTGFWAYLLYRARPAVPFRPVARAILWADLIFTGVGGVMLTVTGILLIQARGYPVLETPWLLKGIVALAVSTTIWLAMLLPDQRRLERLDAADEGQLRRLFTRWMFVGWGATVVLFYGLWVMVTGSRGG